MTIKQKSQVIFTGGVRVPLMATAALPAAASHEGYIAYDTTLNALRISDGAVWQIAGGGRALTSHADDYTALVTDANTIIDMTKGTATTFTIPANATIAFPIGTMFEVLNGGAGVVTVAVTTDTLTVDATFTAVLGGAGSVAYVRKVAATEWVITGDLVAA